MYQTGQPNTNKALEKVRGLLWHQLSFHCKLYVEMLGKESLNYEKLDLRRRKSYGTFVSEKMELLHDNTIEFVQDYIIFQ